MTTFESQEGWVPLVDKKDCSHGFCTIYCPQWCYVLFPPPPAFSYSEVGDNSGSSFSPLVIAIIGILSTAFLLICYYTVVSKYCNSSSFRRRRHSDHHEQEEESGDQSQRQENWHLPPSNGLDEALIAKIAVCRYKTGEGLVDGTDCSVCLAEFREGDSLRLLPMCSHAFHLQCIDTWLKSHSNCPLCRASIAMQSPDLENRLASAPDLEQERVVVVIEDLDLGRVAEAEEEEDCVVGNAGNAFKDFEVIEIGEEDERLFSMGSASQGRVLSIADVLQVSMEDDGSRCGGGENTKGRKGRTRGLHRVMSPVRMKRSVSSGRSYFARHGREAVRFFSFKENSNPKLHWALRRSGCGSLTLHQIRGVNFEI